MLQQHTVQKSSRETGFEMFWGLLGGSLILCAVLLLGARTIALNLRPAWANAADVNGSPGVAIAAIPVKTATLTNKITIKFVYADGHVGDGINGPVTLDPPMLGGSLSVDSMGNLWACGTDNQLYYLNLASNAYNNTWEARGSRIP